MAACVRARRGERRGGALSRVAPLDVAEWRVRLYDANIAQVAQREQVLLLAGAVDPPAAEGERVEVLVDHAEQLLRLRSSVRRAA